MILEDLHERYLPTKPLQETIMLKDGTTRSVDCTKYHQILIGGDQLTVARVRGAVGMRITHDTPLECLTGMLPVVEDWHAGFHLGGGGGGHSPPLGMRLPPLGNHVVIHL